MSGHAAKTSEAADCVARRSYGRLVALLAAPTGDLELAQDTLSDAFEQALITWSVTGVPQNPEGWILTVARNRQRDVWKSAHHRRTYPLEVAADEDTGADGWQMVEDLDPDEIPDRRLALLFVCAHPAIAANVRTPLMLQSVLGFDSARVAQAFAIPPKTMQQRLVRAKRRIQRARIPFEVPGTSAMSERLPPVLEAVYGCYSLTWAEAGSLAGEARFLAVTLATLLGEEPEAWSLAALLTLASARDSPAETGFQPLTQRDASRWDLALVAEGEAMLRRAERPGRAPGRFQLEAAIQAVHCDRVHGRPTDWSALATLYAALVALAPSLGSHVAQAAVIGRTESPQAGLKLLDSLPPERERFQPFHATRADLLARAGLEAEAAAAFRKAAEMSSGPAITVFLRRRADTLGVGS